MVLINKIKSIIINYSTEKYFHYINSNNLLLVKDKDLKSIITDIYNNNVKDIKSSIRTTLKDEMLDNYPSATIENIIFDIFQDNSYNIDVLYNKILLYQNENYFEIEKEYNNSLGIKIYIDNNFCVIQDIKDDFPEKDTVIKYKYLYSINDNILNLNPNLDSNLSTIIKETIDNGNNNSVKLGFYLLN
tara:strand:- start:3713 stop:4276 length:564 start_codon:yes stop_codon:yes gene_type:complete